MCEATSPAAAAIRPQSRLPFIRLPARFPASGEKDARLQRLHSLSPQAGRGSEQGATQCSGMRLRHIVQNRPQPTLDFANIHALALGIVFHLVTLDLGNAEIIAVRVADIDARNR